MKNEILGFFIAFQSGLVSAMPPTYFSNTGIEPDVQIAQECNIEVPNSCGKGSTCTALWNSIQNRVQYSCVSDENQIPIEKGYEWLSPPASLMKVEKGDYIVEFRFLKNTEPNTPAELHPDAAPLSAFTVIYKTAIEKKFITNLGRKTTAMRPIHKLQSFAAYSGQAIYNDKMHFVLKPLLVSGSTFPEVCDGASDLYSEWALSKSNDLGLQAVSLTNRAPQFCPWMAQVYEIRTDQNKLIWKTPIK